MSTGTPTTWTERRKSPQHLLLVFAATILLLPARSASAAPTLVRGTEQIALWQCAPDFQNYVQLRTYTGYVADPALSLPKTGDIAYVVAVAINSSPCGFTDSPSFDFFLPNGASFAISAANPVICYRGIVGGQSGPLPNDSTGRCLQTPIAGPHGGASFGFARLQPTQYLEIQVPVRFDRKLSSTSSSPSDYFKAQVTSAFATTNIIPFVPVNVVYEADFENLATTNITATAARVVFDLKSYFNGGTLFVDYGTSPSVTSSLPPTSVPNTHVSFLGNSAQLPALLPSTTYYWRARFVTTDGTFTSPVQTFTTGSASPQLLTVAKFGEGTVTSAPAGIACGSTCSASFPPGTNVTLTPTPGSGWLFAGWSGECTGTGACAVAMTAPRTVNASFSRELGSISVTLSGLPAGTTADLTITGPDGLNVTRTLTTGMGFTLSDVGTGSYTVTAPTTTVMGTTYVPVSSSQTVAVAFGVTTSVSVVYRPAAQPPSNVDARAVFSTAIEITWRAPGKETYEVQRLGVKGQTVTIGSSNSGSLVDKSASPNTAYLYRVRQIAPAISAYSASDLATTVMFTDPTLGPGVSIKAAHFTELRTAIDAVRALTGLSGATYSEPAAATGSSIGSAHLTDLRAALVPAYLALNLPAPTFTTPVIAAGTTIRATDITDLRNAVR